MPMGIYDLTGDENGRRRAIPCRSGDAVQTGSRTERWR